MKLKKVLPVSLLVFLSFNGGGDSSIPHAEFSGHKRFRQASSSAQSLNRDSQTRPSHILWPRKKLAIKFVRP